MNGRSTIKSPVGCRCHYILKRCMAVHLRKQSLVRCVPQQTEPSPYWMYDNGYLIFQSFLESNLKCVWNRSLVEAMQVVKYEGYVSPGVLLLTSDPCSMEVIRGAWCRNVLRPPNSYVVTKIGDIEDCVVEDLNQGQFTPLSEALCLVILELTSANQNATIDTVRSALKILFSNIQPPAEHVVYDAIVNLMSENKIYQTSRGYFVVTPEVQRLVGSATASPVHGLRLRGGGKKAFLMSTEEAYVKVHGDIETVRDGDQTHQNIQTNLADIISGGNPDDKKLSPRSRGEMAAGKLERRNSLRSGSATRRLQATLQRSGSMRHISNKNKTDECANNNNCANNGSAEQRKSPGIFSRLFGSRRSSSKSRKSNGYAAAAASTQFPWPPHDDWFNKSVQPQQTTSTQTEKDDEDERFGEAKRLAAARATRSATLPRKSRTVVMAAAAAPSSLAGSSSSGRPDNGSNSNKAATGVTGQTTTTTPAKKAYPSSGSSGYNSLPRMNGGGRKTGKNSPSSETSYNNNNNNKAPAAVSKTTADEDASCGGPDTPTTGRGSNFDSTYSCDEISVNNCASFAVQAVDKTAAAAAANKTAADLRREYFRGPNKYEKGKQQQQQRYFNRDKTTAAVVLGPALLHHKYFENACKIK